MNEAGVRRGRWFQHLFRGEHWTSFVSFRGSSPRRTCPYDGVLASPKAFTLQFRGFRSDKNGPILERSLRFCLHLSCLEVDVVAQLEKRAAANSQKLNWRTSIVDLLKLLDIDSSLGERKALAKELGAPESVMGESAEMNIWLHKEVLKRIAANGGNVPANLLD